VQVSRPPDAEAERAPSHGAPRRTTNGLNAVELSNRMVRLLARYAGRGPTRARTTLNSNLAVVVFSEALTRAERNLVAAGQSETVVTMRRTFQRVMREEAVGAVEEVLGRRVLAFVGDVDPEADTIAYVFTLEPVPESGVADVAEAEMDGAGE
jgi:uncharacterized protein YbcI